MSTELATKPDLSPAIQQQSGASRFLDAILTGELTPEKLALAKEMLAMQSAQAAAGAFASLQAETPRIKATKVVPGNDGGTRYRFAPYEEIMRQVAPLLTKHGFALSYDQQFIDDGKRVEVCCILRHSSGHEYRNKSQHRVSAPPKSSDAQADGATITYAKRFALCSMLNITVETDDDARAHSLNGPVTSDQAEELARRVKAANLSEAKFLQFAGGASFEAIPKDMYGELDRMLRAKGV